MAQLTAPESVVRAILASKPSRQRETVLAALGLDGQGQPCSDDARDDALASLVGNAFDPHDAAQQQLPEEEIPY